MKKYLLAIAVLAMGMAVFTACGSDDEEELLLPVITANFSEADLTVKEGETLVIEPKYANVDENTTYEWSSRDAIISKEPKLTYIFYEYGTYAIRLKVTTKAGTSQQDFRITVNENLVTVDFEGEYWNKLIDSKQYNGPLLYGEKATEYAWNDSITGLSGGLTLAWGGSYGYSEGGTAISNYIDDNIQDHATYEYQLSVPAGNGSKNFAVVYCDATIKFPQGVNHVIKSMQIGPTTYELGVVLNGDGYAASLAQEGNFTLTITANNGKTLDVDMARDGVILQTWQEVDLTSLGEINSLTFTMDGSDKSDYGVKHPKYFAFDNVVVKF